MCLCPITLPKYYMGRKVSMWCPCGKCIECQKDKQNEYVVRTIEEAMKVDGPKWFVTLTFNDANVPQAVDEDGELIDEETGEILSTINTLDNSRITAWKKRCNEAMCRKYGGQHPAYSYLFGGEYGPKTHRPHYHGSMMGLSEEDMEIFKKDWEKNNGFCLFKRVNRFDIPKVAAYIAKYITKVDDLEFEEVKTGKVEKPRKISSVGYGMPNKERWHRMKVDVMGKDYSIEELRKLTNGSLKKCMKVVNKISKSLKYKTDNGLTYKLPRYYKERMFYEKDDQGKLRRTPISAMVACTLLDNVQQDYSRKLHEVAAMHNLSEDYEGYSRAAQIVNSGEEDCRQSRADAIYQANLTAQRKSLF